MTTRAQKLYRCPMHPEIHQSTPGVCSKCGMALVLDDVHQHRGVDDSLVPKRKLKDFLPIIVIFASIISFTALMQIFVGGTDLEFGMRMFMGAFFAVFGFFKVINLKKFADAYQMYDIVAKRSRGYAFVYPFLEILLAILYFSDFGGIARDVFTFTLMSVSAIGVIQKLRQKEEIPCACLGMVFVLPMTWVTLFEDVLMALEALFMILMPLGFHIISLSNNEQILDLHLKIHTSSEWVVNSELGHWIVGAVFLVLLITSIIERTKKSLGTLKYITPTLLIILGLGLSIVDAITHAIFNNAHAVWTLSLTPNSQWFQHFAGGILFFFAGVAEALRYRRKADTWLNFVAPSVIILTGVVFFFHQQLGALPSIISAMYWHMTFGALLVVGGTARILDLLLFQERKSLFVIWIIMLVVATGMTVTYQEPSGAYELSNQQEIQKYEVQLDGFRERWSLF